MKVSFDLQVFEGTLSIFIKLLFLGFALRNYLLSEFSDKNSFCFWGDVINAFGSMS